MKAIKTKIEVLTIELTIEEAHILAELVQNSQMNPQEEPVEVRELRHSLFEVCREK